MRVVFETGDNSKFVVSPTRRMIERSYERGIISHTGYNQAHYPINKLRNDCNKKRSV